MRSPITLRLWSVFILAIAGFNLWSWQSGPSPKDGFTLAVGIFCALVGIYTLVMSFKLLNKKGN